jgi:cell division initiation protein
MRISVLDIRNHTFPRRMNGYDREEVDGFLRMVAEDYEAALRDAQAQRDQVRKLEVRVEDLAANEEILQQTLTTAQRLSDELKRTAVKEAELLVGEAEVKAEKILDAAHRRAARLAEDIREMKQLRSRLAAAVRAAIETHLGLLEGLAERGEEDPGLEGRMAHLVPSPRDAKAPAKETPER